MSGLVFGVEEHGHRHGGEPETEQHVADPRSGRGTGKQIVVDAYALSYEPQKICRRSQAPHGARQPFRPPTSAETRDRDQTAQDQLEQVRQKWAAGCRPEGGNHTDMRQQKNGAGNHQIAFTQQLSRTSRQTIFRLETFQARYFSELIFSRNPLNPERPQRGTLTLVRDDNPAHSSPAPV